MAGEMVGGWGAEALDEVADLVDRNRLIEASAANTNAGQGRIRRRERLGGLLNFYYRDAA